MSMNLEKLVHWRRSPTVGLRFVRVTKWYGSEMPHAHSLMNAEVLGWTLTAHGAYRLFYIRTDLVGDGCGDWSPDPRYPDTAVDPASIRPRQTGSPPSEEHSPPDVAEIEAQHRKETREHWAAWHANQALIEKAEREAAERAEAAERFTAPTKQSFWSRLFG